MKNLHKLLTRALEKTLATKRFIQITGIKNNKRGQLKGFATIDSEDFNMLNKYKWWFDNGYAVSQINKRSIRMHRLIVDAQNGLDVDHENRIKLDNRKYNLRICTHTENLRNSKKPKGCSSNFKGIYWNKKVKKWQAQIQYKGNKIYLGLFEDEIEAAKTYDKKAIELFGEFARTNKQMGFYKKNRG